MLSRILEFSLRHRLVVILVWIGLSVSGALAWKKLPMDAFPDVTPVQVQVNTVAETLGPLEIERQVTAPIEQVLAGLPKLREVRSLTRFGLSQVTLLFEDGTDLFLARQLVAERLQTAQLPAGVQPPKLGPISTGLGEVFHYTLASENGEHSLGDLRTLHDWVVRPQLRSVPGVAEVNAWGGDERQFQVVVDPVGLQAARLQLRQLIEAIEANNRNVGGVTIPRP